MNWRVEVIDIVIIMVVYMLVQFASTQDQPVTDWVIWVKATGMAALYKAVPPAIGLLGSIRTKYSKTSPSEE